MNLIDLAIIFLGIGLTEAVVKSVAKRFVQLRILRAAPVILRAIDAHLHELLTLPTGAALQARVRSIAAEATGEGGPEDDLGPLFELFDLRRSVG